MRDDRRTGAEARAGERLHAAGAARGAARVASLHLDLLRHPGALACGGGHHVAAARRERPFALAAEAAADGGRACRARGPGGPAGPPPELRALLAARTCATASSSRSPSCGLVARGVRVVDGGRDDRRRHARLGRRARRRPRSAGSPSSRSSWSTATKPISRASAGGSGAPGARRPTAARSLMRVLPRLTAPDAPWQEVVDCGELLAHQLRAQLVQLEAHDPGVRAATTPRTSIASGSRRGGRGRSIRATRRSLGDRLVPLADELAWLAGMLGAGARPRRADRAAARPGRARRRPEAEEPRRSSRRSRTNARHAATNCSPRSDSERYLELLRASARRSTRCPRSTAMSGRSPWTS